MILVDVAGEIWQWLFEQSVAFQTTDRKSRLRQRPDQQYASFLGSKGTPTRLLPARITSCRPNFGTAVNRRRSRPCR